MTTNEPAAWVAHRVHAAIGRRPVGFRRAEAGGYTPAEHWLVEFEQGPSAFVKLATTENTAQWVRDEAWVYERVRGPFMAEFLGWDEGGEWPFLVLEDLTTGPHRGSRAGWTGSSTRLRPCMPPRSQTG